MTIALSAAGLHFFQKTACGTGPAQVICRRLVKLLPIFHPMVFLIYFRVLKYAFAITALVAWKALWS